MKKIIFLLLCCGLASANDEEQKSEKIDDTYTAIMSTSFKFDERSVSGELRAPDGFMLQGRKKQSYSQMVSLRTEWNAQFSAESYRVMMLSR